MGNAPPQGKSISLRLSDRAAQALSYYAVTEELGVLAPRGWHCYGGVGSGGDYHSGGLSEVAFRGFTADDKDARRARGRAAAGAPPGVTRIAGEPVCAWAGDRRGVS